MTRFLFSNEVSHIVKAILKMLLKKKSISLYLFFILHSLSAQTEAIKITSLSDSLKKHVQNSQFEKATNIIKKTDSLLIVTSNDTIRAKANKLKGNYYYRISNYENAMSFWLKARHYYELIHDSIGTSKILNNVSLILNSTGDFEKSLQLKKEALKFCPETIDQKWNLILLQNIASNYRHLKKYDSSLYYLDKSYHKAIALDSKYHLGIYYHNKSIGHIQLGNYTKAINYADTVQAKYKNDIPKPMLENSIYYMAKALLKTRQYTKAIEKASISLDMTLKNGMIINASDTYKLISTIYQKTGKYKLSLEALQQSNIYKDSIFNLNKNKAVIELEKKYETEKKEKENLLLKQETLEKDTKIARKNNIILASILCFVCIIISLIAYQLKKSKSKNEALKEAIQKHEKLQQELEIVRDNIAKDFHDDLGNKLARITTLSELMVRTSNDRDKENIIQALKSIKMDSDILFKGTRDFMFSIKAKSDYLEELFTYLSDFGEEFFESFNIDFFIEKQLQDNIKLPYYWNRQIIMIFKEAITNIIKHAEANIVTLSIFQKEQILNISLSDNGKGFNKDKLKLNNGILNMQSRAKKIHANLEITSNQQQGTLIKFTSILPK